MARRKRESEQDEAHRVMIEHRMQCGKPLMDAAKEASEELPETMRLLGIKPNA